MENILKEYVFITLLIWYLGIGIGYIIQKLDLAYMKFTKIENPFKIETATLFHEYFFVFKLSGSHRFQHFFPKEHC